MKIAFAGKIGVDSDQVQRQALDGRFGRTAHRFCPAPPPQVDLSVTAGSVNAEYVTYSSSEAAMNAVEQSTRAKMGTRADMQSVLALAGVNGVTVESDPSIGTSAPADNSALVIGLSIGGAFLGIILIFALFFVAKGRPLPPPLPPRRRYDDHFSVTCLCPILGPDTFDFPKIQSSGASICDEMSSGSCAGVCKDATTYSYSRVLATISSIEDDYDDLLDKADSSECPITCDYCSYSYLYDD